VVVALAVAVVLVEVVVVQAVVAAPAVVHSTDPRCTGRRLARSFR